MTSPAPASQPTPHQTPQTQNPHPPEMPTIDLPRQKSLLKAAQQITHLIASATPPTTKAPPRLVLVSKLKPASDILALHRAPIQDPPQPRYTHFGENYLQELRQKSHELPPSIRWHFIGGLQSNKAKALAAEVRSLWCVSSVDSAKKADELEKGRAARERRLSSSRDAGAGAQADVPAEEREEDGSLRKLNVHVQVNTSGEASKSGVSPGEETTRLCRHILSGCPRLRLVGLMTIGAIGRSEGELGPGRENEDFARLREERDRVVEEVGCELELSMGMSGDFESAVRCGSGEVRVGSTVFGERPFKGSGGPNSGG